VTPPALTRSVSPRAGQIAAGIGALGRGALERGYRCAFGSGGGQDDGAPGAFDGEQRAQLPQGGVSLNHACRVRQRTQGRRLSACSLQRSRGLLTRDRHLREGALQVTGEGKVAQVDGLDGCAHQLSAGAFSPRVTQLRASTWKFDDLVVGHCNSDTYFSLIAVRSTVDRAFLYRLDILAGKPSVIRSHGALAAPWTPAHSSGIWSHGGYPRHW
jgi:hypothetical protein